MKSTKLFLMALAMGGMLVSCNKADDNGIDTIDPGGQKSVSVTIANQTASVGTRTSGALTTGDTNTIPVAAASELRAVFADGDEIIADTLLSELAAEDIVESVYTFHKLPSTVDKIAITDISGTFETLTELQGYAQSAAGLIAQQGALSDILVYGETEQAFVEMEPVHTHEGVTIKFYDAGSVTVAPLLSRIEIGSIACSDLDSLQITGTNPEADTVVVSRFGSLTLKAIGIHNTHDSIASGTNKLPISYAFPALSDPATDAEKLAAANALAAWNAAVTANRWNVDAFAANTVLDIAKTPFNGAFVYNIVPGLVPNIILEIGSATWNEVLLGDSSLDNALEGPFFVKTSGLSNTSGAITTIAPGTIYQVNFSFPSEKVKAWVEDTSLICVDVIVTIPNWTIESDLTPVFE